MKTRCINEQKQICVEDLLAKKNSSPKSLERVVSTQPVPQVEKYLIQLPASSLSNLASSEIGQFLTTKEACLILKCSKATLLNYKKAGILEPWQKKPRGLTRWSLEELRKIRALN
jgi:hypothetical protein